MTDAISLHVLCRYENARPKGLKLLDPKTGLYESYSWRVGDDQLEGLKGKTFCMHQSKSEDSYLSGEIVGIVRRKIEDNNGEERAVVTFTKNPKCKGIKWPPTNNPNEYCHVNADVPLELLRKR